MNVLIVDDNRMNLNLFIHMLEMVDYAVPVAMTDPCVALQWCASNVPDLIVVDYMMPVMDGLEFLKRVRELPGMRDVPVVMVTAATEVAVRHEALRLSANDFLTKPVNNIEFNVRIGNLLALRKAQLQLAARADSLSEAVNQATAAVLSREREVIHRLSLAAEFRDQDTGTHLLRMAAFARLIAQSLGLSEQECDLVHEAAPMHDIGKVGIPDAVLLKPGALDADELSIMRRHPEIGASILANSDVPLLQAGAVIAISHHERYDGLGYPHGLAGDTIPLYGRIVAVADVYDALTTCRPYKARWDEQRALAYLEAERGKHFDPQCVDALLANLDAVRHIQSQFADPEPALRNAA